MRAFTCMPGGVTVGDSRICYCVPCLSSAVISLLFVDYTFRIFLRVIVDIILRLLTILFSVVLAIRLSAPRTHTGTSVGRSLTVWQYIRPGVHIASDTLPSPMTESESGSRLAGNRTDGARVSFGSLFSSKLVIYGHFLVTLSSQLTKY